MRHARIRKLAAGIVLALAPVAVGPVQAQSVHPVVIELYTSQGCSSCPPADDLLTELSKRDDVIALSLHVNIWDYIGWKDSFAQPAFSDRQRGYVHAKGAQTVYTPQMVINGRDHVVGTKPMRVTELIMTHREDAKKVKLDLHREGDTLSITASAPDPVEPPLVVYLLRYIPSSTVNIGKGENAGRQVLYTNVVTELTQLQKWDATEPLDIEAKVPGDQPVAVLMQQGAFGPIEAAARLE